MTRGEGSNKEEWYSICSWHQEFNKDCDMCNCGKWVNVEQHEKDSEIWERNPNEWRHLHRNDKLEFEDFKTGERLNPFPNLH